MDNMHTLMSGSSTPAGFQSCAGGPPARTANGRQSCAVNRQHLAIACTTTPQCSQDWGLGRQADIRGGEGTMIMRRIILSFQQLPIKQEYKAATKSSPATGIQPPGSCTHSTQQARCCWARPSSTREGWRGRAQRAGSAIHGCPATRASQRHSRV